MTWDPKVHGVTKSQTRLSLFTFWKLLSCQGPITQAGYRLLLLLRDTSMVQLGPDCCYIMLALMNLIGNDHFIILLSNKTTPKEEITRKNHVISDELQTSLFSLWF